MQNKKKNPNLEMSLEKGIFCIKFFNEQPKTNHNNMTSNNEGYSSNCNVPYCVCHCKYNACTKDSYFMKAREINRKQNPKEKKINKGKAAPGKFKNNQERHFDSLIPLGGIRGS